VLKCLVSVALYHKAKGRSHGDLQPQTVQVNSKFEIVCVNNYPLFPGGHHLLSKVRREGHSGPLSPEDSSGGAVFDEFASEVWSIGMTALCYAARKPLAEFYDCQQVAAELWKIEACLREFSQSGQYSPSLLHVFISMLHRDPKKRAKAEEIQAIIDMYDDDAEEEAGSHLDSLRISAICPAQEFSLDSAEAPGSHSLDLPQDFREVAENPTDRLFAKIKGLHSAKSGFVSQDPFRAQSFQQPQAAPRVNPLNARLNFKQPAIVEPPQPQPRKPGVVFLPEKLHSNPSKQTESGPRNTNPPLSLNSTARFPLLISDKNMSFVLKVPQETSFQSPATRAVRQHPAKTKALPRTAPGAHLFRAQPPRSPNNN
jgi:hypothetical protein